MHKGHGENMVYVYNNNNNLRGTGGDVVGIGGGAVTGGGGVENKREMNSLTLNGYARTSFGRVMAFSVYFGARCV